MVMDSEVHAYLHPHCHHQISFAKSDLNFFYPPLYKRTVWYFSQTNSQHIKRVADLFDWKSALTDLIILQLHILCQI